MKFIVNQFLLNTFSYIDYRKHIEALLKDNQVTGNEQTQELVHYSQLNQVRMTRLDKTIKISIENTQKLKSITKELIWLVITEGWCGDAAQILPIIHKMSNLTNAIDLKIILRDQQEQIMNLFLTNGAKAIPKLIVIDKNTFDILGDFGPRPLGAKQFINGYKSRYGVIDETAKTNLQLWYLHDKGLSTQNEIMDLMNRI